MKKILAILCSVVLLGALMVSQLPANIASAAEPDKLIYDFNGYADTDALIAALPYINAADVSLDTTVKNGDTGASLRIALNASYNEVGIGYKSGNGWVSNWSKHNALSFWVKADKATGPEPGYKLEFRVQDVKLEGSGVNTRRLKAGAPVLLNGTWDGNPYNETKYADADGNVYFGTAFEGTVTIPFESIDGDNINFNNIYRILFCYGGYFKGEIINIDDLKLTTVDDDGSEGPADVPAVDSGKPAIVPDNAILINNFDSYADDAALAAVVSAYNNSAVIKLESEIQDGDGKSFSYTIGTAFATVIIKNDKDLTGATGIRFWVKYHQRNPLERTFVKIWFCMDADGKRWHPAAGMDYTLTDLSGDEPVVTNKLITADGEYSVVIDHGFDGYVDIPFTSFTNESAMYDAETNPIALDKVDKLLLQTSAYFNGSTIYIDSLYATRDEASTAEPVVTVDDENDLVETITAAPGAFPFDTTISVKPVAAGSALEENLLELLQEYTNDPAFNKALFMSMSAVRTGTEIKAELQGGKKLTVTAAVPEGFDPAKVKVVVFDGGEVKLLDSEVENGFVTFDLDTIGTLALIEYEEPAEPQNPQTGDAGIYIYLLLSVLAISALMIKKPAAIK